MKTTRTLHFGWIFLIAAILVLTIHYNIVWWQAVLVALLATLDFTVTWTRSWL